MDRKSEQKSFFDTDFVCSGLIPEDSFYNTLYELGPALITDDDFAEMYCHDNGRKSIPPSILALTMLLQAHDDLSDRAAADAVKANIFWKHALRVSLNYKGFDYSNLSRFRSKLLVHELENKPFIKLNQLASELGLIKAEDIHAVDSTAIIGHAELKDTYALIAEAISKTVNSLLESDEEKAAEELKESRLAAYCEYEKPDIDWEAEKENRQYLKQLVEDAREVFSFIPDTISDDKEETLENYKLLADIIQQDIVFKKSDDKNDSDNDNNDDDNETDNSEMKPDIKNGVAEDRIISTVDPEMRHGRKSSSQRFDGFKGHITENLKAEWITNVKVSPANERDCEIGTEIVTEQKDSTGYIPKKVLADNGYGTSDGRAEYEEESIELISPVRDKSKNGYYHKYEFEIDLENMEVTCPAGKTTDKAYNSKDSKGRRVKVFHFKKLCDGCSERTKCTKAKNGRTITLVYNEELVLKALKQQRENEDFKETYNKRYIIERKIAELFHHHGMRNTSFFGIKLTELQLFWKATAVNLKRLPKLLANTPEVCLKKAIKVLKELGSENNGKKAASQAV